MSLDLDLVSSRVGSEHIEAHFAEAQGDHPIGNLKDLIEVVADEEDRDTLIRHTTNEIEVARF